MALCKKIQTKYLVEGEYHKIVEVTISWHYKVCDVQIASYKDKEARDNGGAFLDIKSYNYQEDAFDFDVEGNLTEQLYSKIKQESEFIDATDC
jgi:hypothetical protein